MLSVETRARIREEFRAGHLQVYSVRPDGSVCTAVVLDVMQHRTPHKKMLEVQLPQGVVICTEDHSLFSWGEVGVIPVLTSTLRPGAGVVVVQGGQAREDFLLRVLQVSSKEYTYDLSVPGTENFVLSNGVLAHNSYSIGGISLDIEKSSKYESLKQNAEGQFDKATEFKARTVKFMRGLQQPRFGIGIRSAFGPYVGKGVLSPRGFI